EPKKPAVTKKPEPPEEAPDKEAAEEVPAEVAPPTPEATPEAEEVVREHIEMKAPKLEGPKILGKIELPVNTIGGKQERKEKRKRKRIPVDKKPESKDAKPVNNAPRKEYNHRPGQNRPGDNRRGTGRGNQPTGPQE